MHDTSEASSRSLSPAAHGRSLLRVMLRAPLTRRVWRETSYCLLGFPLGLVGGVVLAVLLALGAGLAVSLLGAVVGVLILVTGVRLARALGSVHRRLAAGLLGERLPALEPPSAGTGLFGRLDAGLRDGAGWRAVSYVLVKLPVSALGMYAVLWWLTGLVNVTAPLRWAVFGQQPSPGDPDGMPVLTPIPAGGLEVDTFAGTFGALALGLALLLLAPWPTRLVVAADRWLLRALLGPSRLADRVRDLEETRALAVDDSVALLRRLERDLHDGAQVRLVAVAMSLDMIKERLGKGDTDDRADPSDDPIDLARVRQLVDGAHRNATEALTELRDLARGLHPPVLDDGLPDALATLAARSSIPVELTADVPRRPTPAIETIAYFCAAELLTNVIKHSGATQVILTVDECHDGMLRLQVVDDGRGGAAIGAGSGLTGLVQRVRTVDGRLVVHSPDGGPTTAVVELPMHA
ncbi:sensor histidine kinase [Streptomyces spectabilis]|uniref:histidine kinase n=1 Tax=Streptomyces spectabilis TaxID=68270 RepID=A0A516RJ20_STRST|nr:sensor histidine kinase [Streptomyces spectabilis]QDQ15649.1 sensor histidine kinase [Streptomyces spectabilis]